MLEGAEPSSPSTAPATPPFSSPAAETPYEVAETTLMTTASRPEAGSGEDSDSGDSDSELLTLDGAPADDGKINSNNKVSAAVAGGADAQPRVSTLQSLLQIIKFTPAMRVELAAIFSLAWPVVISMIFQMLIGIINSAFVGHYLTTPEFDATGLAVSFTNVFGVSVGVGLATACDTLCSQAFGGNDKRKVGLAAQRGILIILLACFPCWAIWINAEGLLLSLNQDPIVAKYVSRYCKVALPMLPASIVYTILQKYMQAQGLMHPMAYVGFAACCLAALLNYLVLGVVGMRLDGSALVLVLSNYALAGFAALYIRLFTDYKLTWHPWNAEVLREWKPFVKLALPGLCMVCAEWWSFEIILFLSGVIGTTDLGAMIVILQIAALLFMIPLGISIATTVRVGNMLGGGHAAAAHLASLTSRTLIVFTALSMGALLMAVRGELPKVFNKDHDVVQLASRLLIIVVFFQVFDGTQAVCSGILRGAGRQTIGAVVNLTGYYAIGLPLGAALAFPGHMGIEGLWIGLVGGLVFQALTYSAIIIRMDWQREAALAVARVNDGVEVVGDGTAVQSANGEVMVLAADRLSDPLPEGIAMTAIGGEDVSAGMGVGVKVGAGVRGEEPSDDDDDASNNDDDSAPLLATDGAEGGGGGGEGGATKAAEAAQPLRSLVLRRVLVLVGMAALFAVGLMIEGAVRPGPICYPMPSVDHAESVCGSKVSILAPGTCDVVCTAGFELVFNNISCNSLGHVFGGALCAQSAGNVTTTMPPL